MQARVVRLMTGLVAITTGSPARKATHWPMRIALKRISPSMFPTPMNIKAISTPESIATKLPRSPEGVSLSKKKRAIPKRTISTTARSLLRIFLS